jgi:hypothetical protein
MEEERLKWKFELALREASQEDARELGKIIMMLLGSKKMRFDLRMMDYGEEERWTTDE